MTSARMGRDRHMPEIRWEQRAKCVQCLGGTFPQLARDSRQKALIVAYGYPDDETKATIELASINTGLAPEPPRQLADVDRVTGLRRAFFFEPLERAVKLRRVQRE